MVEKEWDYYWSDEYIEECSYVRQLIQHRTWYGLLSFKVEGNEEDPRDVSIHYQIPAVKDEGYELIK